MDEQRELIPSMEKPLEAETHEQDITNRRNRAPEPGPVDPPAEENLVNETLLDKTQPGNTIFSMSPEDEAYSEGNLENDNFSRDTIVLGSPEREIHGKVELEDVSPLGDTVPDETLPDANTLAPV